MKKNHIINSITGNCFCGISPINQMVAFDHENAWFDSNVNPIDHSNYKDALCINCMRLYDETLIDQFELDAFLVDYRNRLPKIGKAMRFFKRQSQLKRKSIDQTKTTNQSKPSLSKAKPTNPVSNQSIPKTTKGKARAERKSNQSAAKVINQAPIKSAKPTESIKPEAIIELKDEIVKPLIDLSNGPVLIADVNQKDIMEVIETIDPSDDWSMGDPIDDDTIFELVIGNDWKLIRHDKQLNEWKFVNRQTIKGIPNWIDDSEYLSYKEVAQLVIDGYCE